MSDSKSMRKIILSGMLGNGLEWYDYALYTYMALIFSKYFFPAGHEDLHLLATFGIFAVGFVARPFGGIFFGMVGDKFGRRSALMLSIFMMAIPTGCIGLLPTYEQIGMWSPVLLVVLRILQGLSLGGAFCGSITFLVEHAPINKRGMIGSATVASLAIGFLMGSVIASLTKLFMTDLQFETWGWRIPFLLGVPIGFIGLYIREHCEESPTYETAKAAGTLSQRPVRDVWKNERLSMLLAIGIYITVTMPFYLVSAYFTTFTEHTLGRSKEEALLLNALNMLIIMVMAPLSGWLSDRIGRKKVIGAGAALIFLSVYPLFALQMQPSLAGIIAAQAIFAVIVGFYIAPVPTVLVEIFPTRVRYTGMALSYNIAAAVFGGTAPMVCQWLIDTTGNVYTIAYYVMALAAVSMVAIVFFTDRYREELR